MGLFILIKLILGVLVMFAFAKFFGYCNASGDPEKETKANKVR